MRPPFIDHVDLPVRDLERSRAFYAAALAPLGARGRESTADGAPHVAFGPTGSEDLGLVRGEPVPFHLAFVARTREEVRAFHAAALAAGGVDRGAPGLRPRYHASYYAAYVLDPDGNNVEVVNHN
jgi:catechol 2,3-dioxygenase-like lactoylglutathione lyase family enzyme